MGHEQKVIIVENKKSLYHTLVMKSYQHLHPLFKVLVSTTLNKITIWIFLTWLQTSMNLQKKLVNWEILIFHNYQVMQKILIAFWSGGGIHVPNY